jgi:hypothetical protein
MKKFRVLLISLLVASLIVPLSLLMIGCWGGTDEEEDDVICNEPVITIMTEQEVRAFLEGADFCVEHWCGVHRESFLDDGSILNMWLNRGQERIIHKGDAESDVESIEMRIFAFEGKSYTYKNGIAVDAVEMVSGNMIFDYFVLPIREIGDNVYGEIVSGARMDFEDVYVIGFVMFNEIDNKAKRLTFTFDLENKLQKYEADYADSSSSFYYRTSIENFADNIDVPSWFDIEDFAGM